MKVTMVKVEDVHPYDGNPRSISREAVDKVARSIKDFGFRQPIVVDVNHVIIVGHTRYRAAVELGMDEVPVHVADNLTDAQIKSYRIADNKTGELSSWDDDLLKNELELLKALDVDLASTGFDSKELESVLKEFEVSGVEAPKLSDGDRPSFRQMTFTVHDEQFEEIESALKKAKGEGGGKSEINENSNGNALAWICRSFNGK